jgi:hypothetical protein
VALAVDGDLDPDARTEAAPVGVAWVCPDGADADAFVAEHAAILDGMTIRIVPTLAEVVMLAGVEGPPTLYIGPPLPAALRAAWRTVTMGTATPHAGATAAPRPQQAPPRPDGPDRESAAQTKIPADADTGRGSAAAPAVPGVLDPKAWRAAPTPLWRSSEGATPSAGNGQSQHTAPDTPRRRRERPEHAPRREDSRRSRPSPPAHEQRLPLKSDSTGPAPTLRVRRPAQQRTSPAAPAAPPVPMPSPTRRPTHPIVVADWDAETCARRAWALAQELAAGGHGPVWLVEALFAGPALATLIGLMGVRGWDEHPQILLTAPSAAQGRRSAAAAQGAVRIWPLARAHTGADTERLRAVVATLVARWTPGEPTLIVASDRHVG